MCSRWRRGSIEGRQGASRGIVSCGDAEGYLRLLNNGNLTLSVVNVGIIVQSTIPLPAGWCHVVATKNGATSKLYINGSDVTGTVSNITCGTPGDDVSIGSATSAGVEFWNGSIGQAAVYNYALTPSQVAKHYALGASAYSDVVIGDAPIGYWKLGDPPVLPTATIVFACGGDATTEPNVASHWSTTAGTVTKDTTHVRSGHQRAQDDGVGLRQGHPHPDGW